MKTRKSKKKTPPRKAPSTPDTASSSLSGKAAAAIILIVVAIVFANTLNNQFVFDDTETIATNPYIRSLTNIPRILGLTGSAPLYRPVRHVSYALDYFFSGLNPIGYHVSNILYHGLAAVVVFALAAMILKNNVTALLAALIFAVHPVQTDSVTYLSGRRDVLCGLFYLLGFWAFIKYRASSRSRYVIEALCCYVASIFSKEMGVTLPAMFLIYDFTAAIDQEAPLKSSGSALVSLWRRHRYFYAAFFAAGGAFSVYKVVFRNPSHAHGYYGGSMSTDFLTVAKVYCHFLKLLVYPHTLNADYSFDAFPAATSIAQPAVLLSLAVLTLVLVLVLKLAKRDKTYLFCGLWFVVGLLPVSQIFPHHELLAEHYLYIPMFGFALFIARAVQDGIRITGRRKLILGTMGIVLLLLAGRTIARNRDWHDDLTLWTKTVATAPECARARNNLGRALTVTGHPREAIDQLREALRIKPRYPEAYANLGVAYGAIGMTDEARSCFAKAIALDPDFSESYYNLGVSYATAGDLKPALEAFEKAVQLNPRSASAQYNLGLACSKLNRTEEARIHLQQALQLAPDERLENKAREALKGLSSQ